MAQGRDAGLPVVGRDHELTVLQDAVEAAVRGPSQVVVVEGEAGIGKSRLVEEAMVRAEWRGYRVFWGSAEELERNRPFALIARALGDELDRRPSAPGPVEPGVENVDFRLVEQFIAVLEGEARERPVLFAADDLQWADPSTLLALRALTRRGADLPLLVLLALRPSPRSRDLSSLLHALLAGGAVHLVLAPLEEQAVAALVGSVLGAAPGMRLRAQAARGGGNPLWVLELLAALSEAGAVEIDDHGAELRQAELPASLRLTILRRLSFLPEETLHVLRVAAVLGSSFDPQDLSICLGRSAVEILPHLAEAVRAGVVGEAGERLAFRHDLVWEVIYEDLPRPLRRGLHLEVGRALATAGRPASRVATHLGIGASQGDQEAVEWLQRAAREAAPRSPSVAAELFEQALRLAEPSDPRRDQLTAERVAALGRSGRAADAEALAREGLAWGASSAAAGSLRWGLAAALAVQGRLREALEETLAAVSSPGLAPGRRARLLAEASQWSFYTGDPTQARKLAEEAINAGERHGDEVSVCLGLTALSRIALDDLQFAQAISLSSEAVARARDSGLQRSSIDWIHPTFDLGGALLTADQLGDAEETLRAGRRLREELGSTWDLPLFTGAIAHVQLYAGRWDDAWAEAKTALGMAEEGATRGSLLWTYSLLAYIALHRDELEAAEEAIEAAERVGGGSRSAMGSDALDWCKGLLHEAAGDVAGAAGLLLEAWERPLPFKAAVRVRMAPDAVRLALATGNRSAARDVTVATEQMAERAGAQLHRGIARRCRGLLERDSSILLEAVAVLDRTPRPVEAAFASEDAAVALSRDGRVEDAVSLVKEALDVYETVGATRDVARAEAALRDFGVHRGRRGPRPKQATGWASLTRSEREVVDLVVRGLTNSEIGSRLFVSPRTVETHLSHVYRKLGVRSRMALAARGTRTAG